MDRRGFLGGIITAIGAGSVTLATDQETKLFAEGKPAVIAPQSRVEDAAGAMDNLLYLRSGSKFSPIGVLTSFTYYSEPGRLNHVRGEFQSYGEVDPAVVRHFYSFARPLRR